MIDLAFRIDDVVAARYAEAPQLTARVQIEGELWGSNTCHRTPLPGQHRAPAARVRPGGNRRAR